ncbi:MAG TPA: DUF4919 domain-containing protein [Terracidiphilus sp.]|jgi:hypothetical protein|nr:DUF4919 domain-containing protein [Terracidiphilus sp.]
MRTRHAFLILIALVVLPLVVSAADKPSEYAALLATLNGGNTSIDFTRLRVSYMDSPEYKQAKDTTDAEKAMFEALDARDFPKALKSAETVLASEYVNIDAHFVAFSACKQMGAMDQAQFHLTIFRGLIDSIRSSGDGSSPEKAWVVITVHEEYVLLRVLGFRPSGQSVMNQNGHSYDVMKVKNAKDGSDQTFYFNVDIPFKHYGV